MDLVNILALPDVINPINFRSIHFSKMGGYPWIQVGVLLSSEEMLQE